VRTKEGIYFVVYAFFASQTALGCRIFLSGFDIHSRNKEFTGL
jgi:hypothetical protein